MTTTPAAADPAIRTGAPPSTSAMIAAVREVQLGQAEVIGALCVAARKAGSAPAAAEFAAATGLIAALDLAADVLTQRLLTGLA